YADFLPLTGGPPGPSGRLASRVGLPAGCTPLIRADRLAAHLGLREVWVKNDAANPTHSFKDRVVSVAVTRARELGFETIACASTGNLANSVAAHGAALGLESYVFIPSNLEEQKILATGIYGTKLVGVEGNYDDVNRLCTELSAERDWAFVNINLRPYYAEGSKTLAFEIAEQLGWELPDRCVVPVASGSLFTKIARGFEEWTELGLLDGPLPRMNGAQAEGCSPVASAFAAGHDVCRPVKPDTIAKSLAIGNPADGPYALDLARSTGGSIDAVSDDEIRAGIKLLAETTGVFTETAGGVTTAVLAKLAARGDIDPDERVVLVITGEGLKTLDAVRDTFETYTIEPSVEAFEAGVPSAVTV
ncbi:MAG TPA: threonine synthase, partial [Solirubrobacteraceae bacterium]